LCVCVWCVFACVYIAINVEAEVQTITKELSRQTHGPGTGEKVHNQIAWLCPLCNLVGVCEC